MKSIKEAQKGRNVPMSRVIIQPASHSDAAEMLAVYAPYVTETTVSSEYEAPSLAEFKRRISSYGHDLPWLVCRIDGKVAGYGYASAHRTRAGYQWSVETSIYVAPAFHRHGIAAALYRALFSILVRQGYYNIFVGITSPNERSIKFHTAMGFVISGAYQNSMYKFGKWRDVIWMAKSLRPHDLAPAPTLSFTHIREEIAPILIAQAQTIRLPGDEGGNVNETFQSR